MSQRDDLALDLDCQGLVDSAQEKWLRGMISTACPHLGYEVARLSFRLVADAEMGSLHQRFSGIPGTTDVLTFVECSSPANADIAICVDEARRQAGKRGHPLQSELLLYAIHAMLHACGLNDATESEAAVIHAHEDRILTAIGVGPVYSRGERGK